jgi:V/A-type H+/Na+-transporting ATPase subunit I
VIIKMARIRVLGPRAQLATTVRALQDHGTVHLIDAAPLGALRHDLDPTVKRRRRDLTRALDDIEDVLAGLQELGAPVADRSGVPPPEGKSAWLAARLATRVNELRAHVRRLADERDALRVYEPLFAELDDLLRPAATSRVSVFLLRLRSAAALDALHAALEQLVGDTMEFRPHTLATGEAVLLLLVPRENASAIEHQLSEAGVERAPLPAALADQPLADALCRLRPRLAEVERELAAVYEDARALARAHGDDLSRARQGFHDALLALAASDHAATSGRAFALEGWLPARECAKLSQALATAIGPELSIEELARDEWRADDAPVVLSNPPLFAPFELLTSLLPLPRYGSIDPTPFVAVFFPILFGVVVGDVGYGLAIAAIAIALRLTSPRTRGLARIAGAVAFFTIIFGVLYGELFGDISARWLGMHALWFDRREAVLGFLVLAVALGVVHLVLGLLIAAVGRWRRNRREAIGRGLTAGMLILVVCALLALFERVPGVLLTPSVIALLVTLPVVVVLEGATALLDFMTVLGHVLSYARVMALGTASVMLAVVANRMHGAFGSAAIGIAFALVFHLVNFAITLFSPTIHVMRLHYVEFFGTFFEPGGAPYQPLRHWSPSATS